MEHRPTSPLQKQSGRTLLTPECISRISTRQDPQEAIRSYLSSQERHLEEHKSRGLAYMSTWDDEKTDAVQLSAGDEESILGTVVLKPRAPRDSVVAHPHPSLKTHSTLDTVNSRKRNRRPSQDGSCQFLPPPPTHPGPKKLVSPRKPRVQATSKGNTSRGAKRTCERKSPRSDQESRLKERKQRRRTKRQIQERVPEASSSSTTTTTSTSSKPNGSERRMGKGGRLATGLALMHGFSARNVRRGRITLQPISGLYHGGKASRKTIIAKGNENTRPHWSELQFLDGRPANNPDSGTKGKAMAQPLLEEVETEGAALKIPSDASSPARSTDNSGRDDSSRSPRTTIQVTLKEVGLQEGPASVLQVIGRPGGEAPGSPRVSRNSGTFEGVQPAHHQMISLQGDFPDESSNVSLRPSQSASQAPDTNSRSIAVARMPTSRYFPPLTQGCAHTPPSIIDLKTPITGSPTTIQVKSSPAYNTISTPNRFRENLECPTGSPPYSQPHLSILDRATPTLEHLCDALYWELEARSSQGSSRVYRNFPDDQLEAGTSDLPRAAIIEKHLDLYQWSSGSPVGKGHSPFSPMEHDADASGRGHYLVQTGSDHEGGDRHYVARRDTVSSLSHRSSHLCGLEREDSAGSGGMASEMEAISPTDPHWGGSATKTKGDQNCRSPSLLSREDVPGILRSREQPQNHFHHGRELLLGLSDGSISGDSDDGDGNWGSGYQTISKAEKEAARLLNQHWLPQRL